MIRRPNGSVRHWPRFDRVKRNFGNTHMWVVIDSPSTNSYLVVQYDADQPRVGTQVARIPYSQPGAFSVAVEIAERASQEHPMNMERMLQDDLKFRDIMRRLDEGHISRREAKHALIDLGWTPDQASTYLAMGA